MSMDNKFVELDISKLFQEHTIKDIELIQKHIQHESDRKKIELRTLVGERYRDLIQAADTIAEMKETSESVIARIINIEETFYNLQQKYLIGFKIENKQENIIKESSCISDSVIMHIKILIDIPEQIWSAIDDKDFLLATQLFLLAQHINYILTFEIGDINLTNKYPIVSKQWSIINQFKNLIFNFCIDSLQSIELSTEIAANCLAALALLDEVNSHDLLSQLISLRSQTIKTLIIAESDFSVKNKIKVCLSILTNTIPLIGYCFMKYKDSEDGLVSLNINDIKDEDAIFLLSHLHLDEELMNKFLPVVTKNYKPFMQHKLEKLSLISVQESVKTWFEWIKQLTSKEVKKLLNLITSIKGIYNVREECFAVNILKNWESIWEMFSLPSIDFWSEFFQPLLTERVKGILNDQLSTCFNNLKKDMVKLFAEVTSKTFEYPENDLRWFVWKDTPTDIPHNLMKGGTLDSKRPLLLKARAFSPNILRLCDNFENGLSELLFHLKQYLYEFEQTVPPKLKDDSLVTDIYSTSNKFSDRNEIQDYLQNISTAFIDNFVMFLKQECIVENPKIGQQDINAIVAARFLQAVPTLCFNFKECFTISRSSGLMLTNIKWQEICDKFKHESSFMWSVWAKCFVKKISQHQSKYLIKETIDELRIHAIITDWEKVMIEEEAEEGKRIRSEILVPHQPAVHLQKFLASICKDFNKVIPHTVPKVVLNEIINSITEELFNYYNKLATNSDIRQKQAIQILFDVKYVTLLMCSRDKKLLVEKSNQICNHLVSKIDPFDFDVFYPFINSNVKKSVQRSLLIYGNLVPHMEQLQSVLGARIIDHGEALKLSVKDPPGVLALCSGTPWFPPLAVTAPAKNLPNHLVPLPEKIQQKKNKHANKEHIKNDSTSSTIKSGAAAFFGAMGSDWFGTS